MSGKGRAGPPTGVPPGGGTQAGPSDRGVDRRAFLTRMASASAAAVAGGLTLPVRPAAAAPVPRLGPVDLPDPASVTEGDPAQLTLAEAAALIQDGRLSPVELVRAYLDRIGTFDGVYQAFNAVVGEAALARARLLEGRAPETPLHGIPLAIKDNYYTAGVRTTANSYLFADFVPDFDAEAWRRLRSRGAILLGKTQMGPLATSRATTPDGLDTTANAWAPDDGDVSPGGSSSGSATAVAARLASSSTGTQTGGSITNPSMAQGLTGIKPTMGRVSLSGIIPLTYTRDHPGPLARDAADAAIMLQAMAGPDPADPRTLGLPPVPDLVGAARPAVRAGRPALRWPTTIGVLPGYLDDPSEEDDEEAARQELTQEERGRAERRERMAARRRAEVAARRDMIATFEDLGASTVELELPDDWETLTGSSFNNVRLPERAEPFLEHLRRDVRLFGVSLAPWINGLLLPGAEYVRGQRAKLLLLRHILDGLLAACDVVVQTSPIPFDIVGLPLVAFPIGMETSSGRPVPVGGLLGGLPYAEDRLLSLAAGYQSVTDWHRRRPADPPAPRGSRGASRGGSEPGRRGRIDVRDVMTLGE